MLTKIARWLWGDLSADELKKFSLLSVTLLFVIGTYWLLRPLKDGIFASIVGIKYQPNAKILSVLVLVGVVMLYAKLVDMFEKEKLFYIFGTFYVVSFAVIGFLLAHPTMGLPNNVESPDRVLGWVTYILIESFGSIMVALFWSFVASNSDSTSAKKGFPLIIFGAQFGSVTGPTLATYAPVFGLPNLVYMAVVGTAMVMVMITVYMKLVPRELALGSKDEKAKPKTGMLEGLKLLLTRPYMLGVLAISTLYEVVSTILDFQMKVLARAQYTTPETYTQFMGRFGQSVNLLAFAFALLGTSYIMRRFGLTFCLVLFPVLVGFIIGYVYINQMLWVMFAGQVAIKGLSYALNNPTKEIMYIPTSKDVKFKAKSWSDVFGSRSAKGTGSGINYMLKESAGKLMNYGTLISLGIVALWIFAAAYVGKTFNKLTKENKIIE